MLCEKRVQCTFCLRSNLLVGHHWANISAKHSFDYLWHSDRRLSTAIAIRWNFAGPDVHCDVNAYGRMASQKAKLPTSRQMAQRSGILDRYVASNASVGSAGIIDSWYVDRMVYAH